MENRDDMTKRFMRNLDNMLNPKKKENAIVAFEAGLMPRGMFCRDMGIDISANNEVESSLPKELQNLGDVTDKNQTINISVFKSRNIAIISALREKGLVK